MPFLAALVVFALLSCLPTFFPGPAGWVAPIGCALLAFCLVWVALTEKRRK